MKEKGETQNSTPHKRKGQYEDEDKVLENQSTLQTSLYHIFLQNYTGKETSEVR